MAGASDYMVGNAPAGASYAAPLAGQFLGQQIAKLPQDYFEGQQRQRTLNLQKPILGPDGQPTMDPQVVLPELMRRGGGEYAEKLIPFFMQQAADQGVTSMLAGGGGSNTGATAPPSATGPASLQPRPQTATPQGRSPQAATQVASQASDAQPTIMKILQAQGIPNDQWETAAASLSRQLGGVGPTDPIDVNDPQVKNVLGPALAQLKRMGIGQVQPPQPGDNGPQAAPQAPGSTAPMQPRPVQTQPITAPAQAAAPTVAQGGDDDATLGGLVPKQWTDSGKTAAQYRDVLSAFASRPGVSGNAKDVALARIKAIDDYMSQGAQAEHKAELEKNRVTNESLNARDPQVIAAKMTEEQNKQDVVRFTKQAQGIEASAAAADEMQPHLELARSLINQPGFYSGTAEGVNLAYKRALAAFGGDSNAPLPQEAFRKVMAANILDQVAQLKAQTAAAGGTGRIFQSQIALMEKAAQNPDNSISANRLLTEIGFRGAARSRAIADMAANYHGGHLDSQFNVALRKWDADHPLFTKDELNDPRRIAPPVLKSPADIKAAGLKSGDPFKTADGRIKYVP